MVWQNSLHNRSQMQAASKQGCQDCCRDCYEPTNNCELWTFAFVANSVNEQHFIDLVMRQSGCTAVSCWCWHKHWLCLVPLKWLSLLLTMNQSLSVPKMQIGLLIFNWQPFISDIYLFSDGKHTANVIQSLTLTFTHIKSIQAETLENSSRTI